MAASAIQFEYEPLQDLFKDVGPSLYRSNPFRVTGLPVEVTAREVTQQLEKLEMLRRLGRDGISKGAFQLDPAPEADALREAKQRLNDPQRRIVDEFFWFWPEPPEASTSDEALVALARGDLQTATRIWTQREDSNRSGLATHNLAVLSHLWALDMENTATTRSLSQSEQKVRDGHWRVAFSRWKILLERDAFWKHLETRIQQLDDPRLKTHVATQMRTGLPFALLSINAKLAVRSAEQTDMVNAKAQRAIMQNSGFGTPAVDEACKIASKGIRDRIKGLCAKAESDCDKDPSMGDTITRSLLTEAGQLLAALDSVLLPGQASRDATHDEVALQGLSCQIPYGNKTENWKVSVQLLDLILPIAASESARARIKDNLAIVKSNLEYQANYSTCWFCRKVAPVEEAASEIKMHGNVVRFAGQVRWDVRTLKIPRCANCKRTHARENRLAGLLIFASYGAYVLACLANPPLWAGVFFALFLCPLLGALVALIVNASSRPRGQKQVKHGNSHPAVTKARSEGWGIGAKPAGVK